MSESQPQDLVLIAVAGVQRFITESRTTLDLRSASRIVARLAAEAAGVIADLPGTELVFPTAVPVGAGKETEEAPQGRRVIGEGMPSRVVALVPAGDGTRVAERVYEHVRDQVWPRWSELVYGRQDHVLPVPGWPVHATSITPGETVECSRRLGRHRWQVERTLAWLAGCRRLDRRYERGAGHFLAFVGIACTLICYRRLAI